ncbi:hypothetical protein PspLS_04599 [Pyricularia sp. CBS 133598]|nr:hypothetical protein PspLS_04599 [Pyricularia sp. CBS 133598]
MEGTGANNFESLLAQLRRTSNQESQPVEQNHDPAQDLIAQFSNYHHSHQPYHGAQQSYGPPQFPEMPFNAAAAAPGIMESHVPAAPSPPVSGFPNTQFPPGLYGGHNNNNAERHSMYGGQQSYQQHGREDNAERQGSLLSLLKFSGSTQSQENNQAHHNHNHISQEEAPRDMIHAPAPAPSDPTGLLAALMRGAEKEHHESPTQAAPAPQSWNSTAQSAESQQYLLNLLNRPKPSQNEATYTAEQTELQKDLPQPRSGPNMEGPGEFASSEAAHSTGNKANMFAYSNPFEELAASSPLNRSIKESSSPNITNGPPGTGQTASVPIQILKKPAGSPAAVDKRLGSERSPVSTPEHSRRKVNDVAEAGVTSPAPIVITVSPKPENGRETVAHAINDLAGKADNEAQLALERAEHEKAQAEIAQDLDEMHQAKSEREFEESAHAAAQAIKKELEKEGNNSVLEETLPDDVAQAVKDIVEEAAHAPVADSWENAAADEIVVIEEEDQQPPVKVYNFPMKPWISISVQDIEEDSRPVFREEAILDIARLKKEFDQVDRNLVAATESYMAYGMSKAGGLRVIRQMDGNDAKMFTDTKDRIFNLSISSTPSDQPGSIHKEAIIGTGISGTVYWVQVKDGEKDHLEDAHPEQYGFALPPISSQEGDAPGGVLKTRARMSTNHPEYFAVGRGKSINIIWPGLIMKNGIFKSGHDRVVDTERLTKECSLKINTGKAGKDFTFSQDDSTIVSLDKSGRVKFWDVRDLTAAKEGSDHRLPARTSLEIKEPLMTLTTTPEGEKAWPTSVLLLDKLRPYQKRGALRYMIVGMKQNHTLQLWDLALGKPVQEFNLPHSKESDAVCSVMYHPPTGMIVVGHPTRNSVYFLHLSAPKYTMKTISQVDYIQKLTAQDSSIPPPESTAVVSGLREYSFGNRGVLRSLDILPNPSLASADEDPALFELYGMHSKGVTCVFVKQGELGWTRDNKVIAPVDAVEGGLVKIEKLKAPAPPAVAEAPHALAGEDSHQPTVKTIVSRNNAKELLPSGSTTQDDTPSRKATDSTPAKSKTESRDEDSAVQPTPATEKSEKRGRKKKTAAAAAAAAEQGLSNGGTASPRVTPTSKPNNGESKNQSAAAQLSISQEALDARIATMESRLKDHIVQELQAAHSAMGKKLDNSFGKREAEFDTKFNVLLDMVSKVLNDNTQEVLSHIVHKQFKNSLIPALRDDVAKSISEQVTTKVLSQVTKTIQGEVQKSLPTSVTAAMKQQDTIRAIGDAVARSVSRNVENVVAQTISTHVAPGIASLGSQLVKATEHISRLEQAQRADAAKIDELINMTTRLTETVASMAAAQGQFQSEILKLQKSAATQSQPSFHQQAPQAPGHQHHSSSGIQHPGQHLASQQPQYGSPQQHQYASPPKAQHLPMQPSHAHSHVGSMVSASSYHSPASAAHQAISPSQTHLRSSQTAASASGSQIGSSQLVPHQAQTPDIDRLASELDEMMSSGNHDGAMMRWLQCGPNDMELFDRVLKNYDPDFLRKLPPLVLLSVGATITQNLDGSSLQEKLSWIEMVVYVFHSMLGNLEPDIRQITPKILTLIKTRIETVFMRISNTQAGDPSLKNLAQMIQVINRMLNSVQPRGPY